MLVAMKLFFLQVAVSLACDARGAPQSACQQVAAGDDEMSMLQAMPPKRGETPNLAILDSAARVESVLLAEAEAEATAPDPNAREAILDPAARVEAVLGGTEALHPQASEAPLLSRIIEFYKSSLLAWPHLTNGIVAYLITTMGDAFAQLIQGGVSVCSLKGFDVKRNVAQAMTTSMYNGMVLTSWLLEINKALPGFDLKLVMLKLAATQTLLQPFVYVPFFFFVHGTFTGKSLAEIRARLRTDYFAFLFRLWSLFMPTRFLMFLIVPVRYQVLWDSTIAFIWQVALSLFNASRANADLAQMMSVKKGLALEAKLDPAAVEGKTEGVADH